MGFNLSDTTPVAPSGFANVHWQKDVSGNISANFNNLGGTSIQTGSYLAAAADSGKLIQFNSASAATYTLLAVPASSSWFAVIYNRNIGAITIARNGTTIDGKSSNLTLLQGDAVAIYSDGTNYFTGSPRTVSIAIFMPNTGTNNQIVAYFKIDRPTIFPASAPNSFAEAKTGATGSTTYTFTKNGVSFATVNFSAGGGSPQAGTFTQAADASFAAGDIFELDGPATADSALANVGFTLQGYRF